MAFERPRGTDGSIRGPLGTTKSDEKLRHTDKNRERRREFINES